MNPRANHKCLDQEGQDWIHELLQERLRLAIQFTLIWVLETEIEAFVNEAPYERTPERRDYRNGKMVVLKEILVNLYCIKYKYSRRCPKNLL